MTSPARFRVEVLFSPGAASNPLTTVAPNHTLPTAPLTHINEGEGWVFWVWRFQVWGFQDFTMVFWS